MTLAPTFQPGRACDTLLLLSGSMQMLLLTWVPAASVPSMPATPGGSSPEEGGSHWLRPAPSQCQPTSSPFGLYPQGSWMQVQGRSELVDTGLGQTPLGGIGEAMALPTTAPLPLPMAPAFKAWLVLA